jgi:hypothetical protein
MATTTVAAPRAQAAEKKRPARSAVLRNNAFRNLQLVLFAAGAVLMPLGIVVIGLGWYGTAHSHYDYDQRTYLISGGVMGLGLVFLGGFLYFGAWLAKVAADQRDSARQLADALLVLAERIGPGAGVAAQSAGPVGGGAPTSVINGAELVFAGDGTTVHRRDCPLVSARDDLRPAVGDVSGATECRVCKPLSLDEQLP